MLLPWASLTPWSIQTGTPARAKGSTPLASFTRRSPVGDQLDINTPLLGPDEAFDDPGPNGQGVRIHEHLALGAVDRIDCKGGAVFLGGKANRDRSPRCHGGDRQRGREHT